MTAPGALGTYEVPAPLLRAVATGTAGSPELKCLRTSQRSLQLLLLRSLLERVAALPAEIRDGLPAPEAAWRLMSDVQEQNPDAVDEVVTDPFVRTWAVRLLRRLDQGSAAESLNPLAVEVGQFHCLAAATVLKAGVAATVRVPTVRGRVWLPSIGVAGPVDDEQWGSAEVCCTGAGAMVRGAKDSVRVSGPGTVGDQRWRPLTPVAASASARHHGRRGGLRLDSVTPYRDFGSVLLAHEALDRAVDAWRERLTCARELLEQRHPGEYGLLAALVTVVVPLSTPRLDRLAVASASSPDSFGAVALSLPPDTASCAAALVHEARHQALNALLALVPLVAARDGAGRPDEAVHFAPWRSDPRPVQGLLHGTYAFAGVADFWRTHRHEAAGDRAAARAHFEFALLREQLRDALPGLTGAGWLTPAGETFVASLNAWVARWSGEEVPELPARLARQVCTGRRALWRLRHLALDAHSGRRLAEAWRSGAPAPLTTRTVPMPRPEAVRPDTWGPLSRLRLGDPREFAAGRRAAQGGASAQMALIAGDAAQAEGLFRRHVALRPDDTEAWIGWAMSRTDGPNPAVARFLLERPETVAGVYEALRALRADAPGPWDIAAWLAASSVPAPRTHPVTE